LDCQPVHDTLDGLINYVCKYAQDYLAVAGLRYRIDVPPQLPATPISPELRHNVFLAAKEAVTNIVRHARASSVWLRLKLEPGRFILELEDNGRGLAGMDDKTTRTDCATCANAWKTSAASSRSAPAPKAAPACG